MKDTELHKIFTYETLTFEQRTKARALFDAARVFAQAINELCPESREKSLAITSVQTAMLWSDAAIAIWGRPVEESAGRGPL